MADLDELRSAVTKAMYDIKPSMVGAVALTAAIDALVDAKIAAAKPKVGRPPKVESDT